MALRITFVTVINYKFNSYKFSKGPGRYYHLSVR